MPGKVTALIQRARETAREFRDEPSLALRGQWSTVHRFVHFWLLVWLSFVRNRCLTRASALSYTTLLALVPLLAVALSITSSLLKDEGEAQIERFIQEIVNTAMPDAMIGTDGLEWDGFVGPTLPASESSSNGLASLAEDERVVTARRQVAQQINRFIQNTRSGTLGIVGTILLIFAVISLLSRIEETMNDIWGVTHPRGWWERIEHYWFAVSAGPILVAAGLALATGPRIAFVREWIASTPFVGGLIFQLLPLVLLWVAFLCFYKLMPATRVDWGAAAVGGIIGSALWFGTNLLGSLYVSRVVTNFKIYGSLGLVPVFMVGLYVSWVILLLGAQVAYAWQNREAYLQQRLADNINQRGREFVALRLMTAVSHRYQVGQQPPSNGELSSELGVPGRLVQQVMDTLRNARLVVATEGVDVAYLPSRPLADITCYDVLHAMRVTSGQDLATRDEPARAEVLGEFARIEEAEKNAASSVTLLALAHRAAGLEWTGLSQPAASLPAPVSDLTAADESPPAPKLVPAPAVQPAAPAEIQPEPLPVTAAVALAPVEPAIPAEPGPPPSRPTVQPSEQPFPD